MFPYSFIAYSSPKIIQFIYRSPQPIIEPFWNNLRNLNENGVLPIFSPEINALAPPICRASCPFLCL